MNSIFNFKRFRKIIRNEYLLKGTSLFMFFGVLMVITALFFLMVYLINIPIEFPTIIVASIMVFLIGQLFIIHIHFGEFTSKEKTQFLLQLPASKTEKFIAKSIAGFILYPLFSIGYFYIVIRLISSYNKSFSFVNESIRVEIVADYLSMPYVIPTIIVVWLFFFIYGALGSKYFP